MEENFEIVRQSLKILVDKYSGGNESAFARDYLHEERSQNLSNWLSGKKDPNLKKINSLFWTIEDLSLEWFFRRRGDMLISNNEREQIRKDKEFNELKKREQLYEGILQKGVANFPLVYTTNQLDDFYNIEAVTFERMKEIYSFTGIAFNPQMCGEC